MRRTLRHLLRGEWDGLIAPLLLSAAVPSAQGCGALAERITWWSRPCGDFLGAAIAISFAVGFAISGLRQSNGFGKIGAILTLVSGLVFVVFLIPNREFEPLGLSI